MGEIGQFCGVTGHKGFVGLEVARVRHESSLSLVDVVNAEQ